jgi:hypothetical protein
MRRVIRAVVKHAPVLGNLILNVRRAKFHKLAWEYQAQLTARRLFDRVRDPERQED